MDFGRDLLCIENAKKNCLYAQTEVELNVLLKQRKKIGKKIFFGPHHSSGIDCVLNSIKKRCYHQRENN